MSEKKEICLKNEEEFFGILKEVKKALKEDHYIEYIKSVHNHAAINTQNSLQQYVLSRDKLFIIASEQVIKNISSSYFVECI